ncbi:MAG: ABC transporter permease [Chloroflexi bacterium]|nr:ABC transporter permease [Chloroflexota bacterium]
MRRKPLAALGLAGVLIWAVILVGADLVTPYGPLDQDVVRRLQPPGPAHLMGTDTLGRDVLSRILHGGRISVSVGVAVVLAAALVGTLLGAVAGFFGRLADELIMRVADLFLAFPPIILALAIAAALGPDLSSSMLAILLVWWPQYARMVRGVVQSTKQNEYVTAARALGASEWYVLRRVVLPNSATPVFVIATLDLGNGITMAAVLSFLGLGVRPPTPDWGSMVAAGATMLDQWWLGAFPGLAIMSVVTGLNLLGDGLRDLLDPRLRHER